MGSTVQQQITRDLICSIWSTSSGDRKKKKKKRLTSGSLEARNTSYISYICITHFRFFFKIHQRQWTKCSSGRWKPTRMSSALEGWAERWLGVLLMKSGEVGAPRRDSAFHPKILCELLDLQQIFSVDCGTGGGQGALHVRLQANRPARSDVSLKFCSDLHELNRLNS